MAAVIAILVVILDLVPNRISAVGVEFGPTRKQSFLWGLLVFVVWFLVRFAVYALSDFVTFRERMDVVVREEQNLDHQHSERLAWIGKLASDAPEDLVDQVDAQVIALTTERLRRRTMVALSYFGWMRVVVDLLVPIGLGLAGAALLLWKLL